VLPYYGITTYPAGASFGPRQMNDWEFVWLLEGDAEYSCNDVTFAAPQNSIVLCCPDSVDFFRWDIQRRTRHAYFHFTVPNIPAYWPPQENWSVVRQPPEDDLLQPLFRHTLRILRRTGEQVDVPETRIAIAHMLTLWVRGKSDSGDFAPEPWPDPVERVWSYFYQRLDNEPDAEISLSELARVAHTTPEHLCRVFKTATGWTPMEAVRLARLDRAAVLLARSNYSIGEIAHQCGFPNAFHFSRRFRDAFGKSPREVRNNLRDGATPLLPLLMRRS
jgi:AraC-like DNA-binding protein